MNTLQKLIGALTVSVATGALANFHDLDFELLDPEVAFGASATVIDAQTLQIDFAIADGYYMYHDKFRFTSSTEGITLGDPQIPPGKVKFDEFFGQVETHRKAISIRVPYTAQTDAARSLTLQTVSQGCADMGVCYPPLKQNLTVALATTTGTQPNSLSQLQSLTGSATATAKPVVLTASETPSIRSAVYRPLAEQDRIAASLAGGNTWLIVASFMGLGILLAFTPCVFPMVPILSSIIVGQGESIGARRAFGLSLVYVLAMASTYTVAGVAVGLSGNNIQVWFQTPWVLISFAMLFVLLSLSMFGFYELQIPASVQSKLTSWSNSQRGGTWLGVVLMGFLSALIVGPCITAPLVGALIYIAETGDAVLGGTALFALSIGMGIPLLMVGTSMGSLLPRAGAWMDAVKSVFGVMLLVLAIWMLERILPLAATMALSAMLLITSGIYMRALEPLRDSASGWQTLWRALGIALLLYGVMLAVGAATGGTGFIHPLKGVFGTGSATSESHVPFRQIKGIDGLNTALGKASGNNQTVMLDFYADWCISCKEMESFTFSDPAVKQGLANTSLLQADVTDNDEIDQALLKQFTIFGPPAILFFDKNGQEIANSRVVGFMSADRFAAHVDSVFMN